MLSFGDILFAAVAAFIITITIRAFGWLKIIRNPEPVRLRRDEVMLLMNRCINLYPVDNLTLLGQEVRRGMLIQIKTLRNRTIVGRFVGVNADHIMCLLTKNFITADSVSDIAEVTVLDRNEELFFDYKA